MCKWALSGRPLSLYKCSQHCFYQGNNSLKYFILPLTYNTPRHLFSRNVFIKSSPEIFTKSCKSRLLQNQHQFLKVMSIQSSISSGEHQPMTEVQKCSRKDKIKHAVKDYGVTVILFHVTLSLISLGLSYLIISSGADVALLLEKAGFTPNDVAASASKFVVAYAFHKLFAPVRISITLGVTPFIVRYLRRVKILKPPKVTSP